MRFLPGLYRWGRGDEAFLKLSNAAADARFYRSHRNVKYFSDIFVRTIFEIKQGNGGLIGLINFSEGFEHLGTIQLIDAGWRNSGQVGFHLGQFVVREAA